MFVKRFALLLAAVAALVGQVAAQDGIPDNCEHHGAYARPSLFPRYDAGAQTLVLVDWTTGDTAVVLGPTAAPVRPLSWSVDCRYLAVASGPTDSMDTVFFDTVNGGEVGRVPDARGIPHAVTWGPENYVIIETRNGATVWHLPTNRRYTYALDAVSTTGRSLNNIHWFPQEQKLTANLIIGTGITIDLATGTYAVAAPTPNWWEEQRADDGATVIGASPDGSVELRQRDSTTYLFRLADQVRVDLAGDVINYLVSIGRKPRPEEYGVRSLRFYFSVAWDARHGQVLLVLQGVGHAVTAFSWTTGEQTGFFPSGGTEVVAQGKLSPDGRLLLVFSTQSGHMRVYDLESNTGQTIDFGDATLSRITEWQVAFSPDAKYLFFYLYGELLVWQMPQDGDVIALTRIIPVPTAFGAPTFLDSTRFHVDWGRDYTVDLATGEVSLPEQSMPPSTPISADPRSDSNCGNRYALRAAGRGIDILDKVSGATIFLSDSTEAVQHADFSPNCRYVQISQYWDGVTYPEFQQFRTWTDTTVTSDMLTTIYDVATGERIYGFAYARKRFIRYLPMIWSPDSRFAIALPGSSILILDTSARSAYPVQLRQGDNSDVGRLNGEVLWDYSRGQVLATISSTVHAIDIRTGGLRYRFLPEFETSACDNILHACYWFVSGDKWLTQFSENSASVWDLDSGARLATVPFPYSNYKVSTWVLSPSGRYLVRARDFVNVWDVASLPEDFAARVPQDSWDVPGITRTVYFVSETTVRVESSTGTYVVDILTGEIVGEK